MLFWKSDKDNKDDDRKKSSSDKEKKKSRPWYDISDDDLLEFDMIDDD